MASAMPDTRTADARQQAARPATLPLAVAAGCYLLMLALGHQLLRDPDTFWQIALGDWMMANRAVPHIDVFSHTMAGKPWISSQWLSQAAYALAYDNAGWTGVVALAAMAIACAFALLARFLAGRLALLPALVLLTGAFVLTAPHLVARPHVLALPVMVAWAAGLVKAVEAQRAPPFMLLPLMALWANLHGGFTFGIMLIAPVALEALVQARPAQRLAVFLRWTLFGVAALAAACITPYGPESILVTGRILGLGPALGLITEWRPQNFATLTGFGICLLFGIGFALHRGIVLPPVRILVLLGLLYMGLSQNRNAEMLGLVGPLFLATPLRGQLGDAAPEKRDRKRLRAPAAYAAAFLLAAMATAGAGRLLDYRPPEAIMPAQAVAAVKASGQNNLLNSYDFGGYLIASGVRVYVDGRTELYGTQFMLRDDRALTLADIPTFLALLDEYDIGVTMLAPGTPAIGLLDRLSGWRRAYADDSAVVHVRDGDAGGSVR